MTTRRLAVVFAALLVTSSAFAKDVYLSITGTVGNFRTDAASQPLRDEGHLDHGVVPPVGNINNSGVGNVQITVPKRQMKVLDDVVAAVFSTSGLGAIRLSCPDDFVATARITRSSPTVPSGSSFPFCSRPKRCRRES